MKKCVGVAVALSVLVLPAVAGAKLIGTQAPSAGERRALTSAFWRAHPGAKSRLRLVGFRDWEHHPVAAAYFLTRAPGGGYAQGAQEYYRRSGSGFRRVSRVPLLDADNLAPAYLFAIASTGSGTQTDAYSVHHPDADIAGGMDIDTTTTTQHFTWKLRFGPRGRPLELGDPGGAVAANALTGAIAFTSTSNDDPTQNFTCAGSLRFTGQGPAITETENARHHRWDFGIEVGGEDVSGSSTLVTTGLDPNTARCPGASLDPERLVGAVRVADRRFAPLSRSASHVSSFSIPFNASDPALAKAIMPHQQSSMTDFDGTVNTSTMDLAFAGSLSFALKGMMLPHGLLGAPDRPKYQGR